MVVTSIVITTIIVFVLVDLLLRMLLNRARQARARQEREQALDLGLKLDVSDEAPTLRRVELDEPHARILAVDDEATVLDSLRKMLVLGGYSVDTVESGAEALGLVRARDYDFVFTDLKMPGMDGVEVTKAVGHLRPDIDVIVITGFGTIETAVETMSHGAIDYVQKPFTEDELLDFVGKALIRRQARLEGRVRHRIRPIEPGTRETESRYELNVPAGAFVSPHHAWARIEWDGTVRVGLDDLVRKLFGHIARVDLPDSGTRVGKGETLFSITCGDFTLEVPSPVSGKVILVNEEQEEHPEWLAAKPFELSWMCGIDPSNLAGDLAELKIGREAIAWYQQELDRFSALASQARESAGPESGTAGGTSSPEEIPRTNLLQDFSRPFPSC